MSFSYADVDDLEGSAKVGSRHCVALVQHYARAPLTVQWAQGKPVLGDLTLTKGTVIATFVDGKYPNHGSGNHAAFHLSQDARGIWIMDQWVNDVSKPTVSKRFIIRKGKFPKGGYVDPSNNADAYSVVE